MKKMILFLVILAVSSCMPNKSEKVLFCFCNERNRALIISELHEVNDLRLSIPSNEYPNYQKHIDQLERGFGKLVINKKKVLPLLFCFKDDDSFTLYPTLPISANHLGSSIVPNYIQALFYFEAIIRNDLFFNRRGTGVYIRTASSLEYINTIIDTTSPPAYLDSITFPFYPKKIGRFSPQYFEINFSEFKPMYDSIWMFNATWIIKNFDSEQY